MLTAHLLCDLPGVEAPVLAEGDGVLAPALPAPHEVHRHVLPVVVMARVHAEGVAAALEAVPEWSWKRTFAKFDISLRRLLTGPSPC